MQLINENDKLLELMTYNEIENSQLFINMLNKKIQNLQN